MLILGSKPSFIAKFRAKRTVYLENMVILMRTVSLRQVHRVGTWQLLKKAKDCGQLNRSY